MTIIEVMVAVVITGVAATGLAGMASIAGRNALATSMSATRLAALTATSERLAALSFDALPSVAGCHDGGVERLAYTNCVRVDDVGDALRRITILVSPRTEGLSPDSVVFERSRAAPASPF